MIEGFYWTSRLPINVNSKSNILGEGFHTSDLSQSFIHLWRLYMFSVFLYSSVTVSKAFIHPQNTVPNLEKAPSLTSFYVWVLFTLCVLVLCTDAWICVPVCLVLAEVRRTCWILWNWNNKGLWVTTWVLRTKLRSSARARTLNHWAVSLALPNYL